MLAKKKREERAKAVSDARAILDKAEAEKRALTADEEQAYGTIMKQVDALKVDIDRLENQESLEAELSETVQRRAGRENISTDEATAKAAKERKAVMAYLRNGMTGIEDPELRTIARDRYQAALSGEGGAAGGYLVHPELNTRIIEAELAFGAMLMPGLCDVINSSNGAPMPFITDNDTGNEGALLSENTQVPEGDVQVGQITLDGYIFTSKLIKVPITLLQDTAIDLEAYLGKKLGVRLGRAKNRYFTVGDGAKKPTGVVTGSTLGVTAASGTIITPDEVIDLEHSVDPAYRANGRYMFHDDILKHLRKKKDGQGRYLWQEGLKDKAPDTINNKPYVINQHMASHATGQKAMLYGDFQSFTIRNVGGTYIRRLDERYADYHQVAFVAFERADSNLLDAGTHPIKHLVMA